MDFVNSTDIAVESSPGAVINGAALILLCQLVGVAREWLHSGGGVSINSKGYDDDQGIENEMIFSDVECQRYSYLTRIYSDNCESNAMAYDCDVDQQDVRKVTSYLWFLFMTEMGSNSSCTNNSVSSDNNTNVQNTMPLFTRVHRFYSFIADTLNMTSICRSSNDTLGSDTDLNVTIFSYDNCDLYIYYVKGRSAENKCGHNASVIAHDRELSFDGCLFYHFMKSLAADSGCSEHVSLLKNCDLYESIIRAVVSTIICVIGLIGNSIALSMFCQRVVKTPTTYQLQWLAVVDITFIVTQWIAFNLKHVMFYANVTSYPYLGGIDSVLQVCFTPVRWVARSCTVWLTVFIGAWLVAGVSVIVMYQTRCSDSIPQSSLIRCSTAVCIATRDAASAVLTASTGTK